MRIAGNPKPEGIPNLNFKISTTIFQKSRKCFDERGAPNVVYLFVVVEKINVVAFGAGGGDQWPHASPPSGHPPQHRSTYSISCCGALGLGIT